MTRKGFDVSAFIAGVGRPTRDIQLCTDADARERMDALMRELDSLPKESADESLAGNPRRDELCAELKTIIDDDATWTHFKIQAPTRNGRIASARALAESDELSAEAILEGELKLLSDCLVGVAGEPVTLTEDDARVMQRQWPDDLVREILDAIRELAGDVTSVPFSRRASESLATPEH